MRRSGYGDYSISEQVSANATRIPTPNVARMAKNGMKFSRGYSGQVCAPSRTMLMLGKHLGHTTIRGNDGACASQRNHLPRRAPAAPTTSAAPKPAASRTTDTPLLASDVTVAKMLKGAGYTTGLIGKWSAARAARCTLTACTCLQPALSSCKLPVLVGGSETSARP